MTGTRKAKSRGGFEESLRRLEEIVERLERGDVPLEESLAMYEEGVRLSRACFDQLQDAELRLKTLAREGGKFQLSDPDDDTLPERPAGGKEPL